MAQLVQRSLPLAEIPTSNPYLNTTFVQSKGYALTQRILIDYMLLINNQLSIQWTLPEASNQVLNRLIFVTFERICTFNNFLVTLKRICLTQQETSVQIS